MKSKRILEGFYKNKDILIPGGGGFIGSNLARRLVRLGARVTIVDPFDPVCGASPFNVKNIAGRVRLVKEKIEDFVVKGVPAEYDVIFNCVGLTNHHIGFHEIKTDYRINCLSGLKILQELARKKAVCRMVSIGSRGQYGAAAARKIDESCPLNPIDVQATHKVALECYHRLFSARYGMNLAFLRMTNIYGPCQRLRGNGIGTIGEIVKNSLAGKDVVVYGSLDRVKDILFVDDAVDAILLLGMVKDKGFVAYNVGGSPCKLSELTDAISKKIRIILKILPFPGNIKKIDTGDTVLDTSLLKKATGWSPKTDIGKGIEITLDYYKKNKGYL